MKCKQCGGEILFQDGVFKCKSCGALFLLESIHEDIDVYICYKENDESGRRTKDSIIAQEVYKKLEEKKIVTFYERISAGGMAETDLEASKLAALFKAKVILVMGSSVENFTFVEKKYGEYFADKRVIPFCVDVNPNQIPKTLSKIQALSYSTIGWDKDLIKGIYNILGRSEEVDTGSLYNRSRRMRLMIGLIAALALVIAAAAVYFILKPDKQDSEVNALPQPIATVEPAVPEPTEKPLSEQEIYEQGEKLVEQQKYCEALELFNQIPGHPNSANMINLIYSKYEGYYQKDNTLIHVEIMDNIRMELDINTVSDEKNIKISTSTEILNTRATGKYQDNHNAMGKLEVVLEDSGICFSVESDDKSLDLEMAFLLSEKQDMPTVEISKNMLMKWLKTQVSFEDVLKAGYELEIEKTYGRDKSTVVYQIRYTDVYLTMYYDDEELLYGVAAPAKIIAPQYIGRAAERIDEGNAVYQPNSYLHGDWVYLLGSGGEENVTEKITENTLVGLTLRELYTEDELRYQSDFYVEEDPAESEQTPEPSAMGDIEVDWLDDILNSEAAQMLGKNYAQLGKPDEVFVGSEQGIIFCYGDVYATMSEFPEMVNWYDEYFEQGTVPLDVVDAVMTGKEECTSVEFAMKTAGLEDIISPEKTVVAEKSYDEEYDSYYYWFEYKGKSFVIFCEDDGSINGDCYCTIYNG